MSTDLIILEIYNTVTNITVLKHNSLCNTCLGQSVFNVIYYNQIYVMAYTLPVGETNNLTNIKIKLFNKS